MFEQSKPSLTADLSLLASRSPSVKRNKRDRIISALCESRDILARLMGATKLEPLIRRATNLSQTKIEDIMAHDLDSPEWETLEKPELMVGVQDMSLSHLKAVCDRVNRWINAVVSQEEYVQAVKAYKDGGADVLNQFLSKFAYHRLDIDPDTMLYHGVEVGLTADFEPSSEGKKLMAPSEYAAILHSISQDGLKAHPTMENLPGLDSAFAVSDPIGSYGVAGVRFYLGEDAAWGRTCDPIEGIQIVKPVVRKPFMVYLKSPGFLNLSKDHEVGSQQYFQTTNLKQYMSYNTLLVEELTKRGMPYVVINPNGLEVQ